MSGGCPISGPGRRSPWWGPLLRRRARRVVDGGTDRQTLTAGADRLLELVEQDLERAESLVEEVLGLVLQTARVGLGGLLHLAGTLLGGPDDLGSLHHTLGADASCFEQFVGLTTGLGHEFLALLEHPSGLTQLLGKSVQRLFEQFDDLVPIDSWRRRQRHRRSGRDDVDRPTQQGFGVADVPTGHARVGILVVDVVVVVVLIAVAVVVAHDSLSSGRRRKCGGVHRRWAPGRDGRLIHRTSRSRARNGC